MDPDQVRKKGKKFLKQHTSEPFCPLNLATRSSAAEAYPRAYKDQLEQPCSEMVGQWLFTWKNRDGELGATRVVRRHWRAGAIKFLAAIIVRNARTKHRLQILELIEMRWRDEEGRSGRRCLCGKKERNHHQSFLRFSAVPTDPTVVLRT